MAEFRRARTVQLGERIDTPRGPGMVDGITDHETTERRILWVTLDRDGVQCGYDYRVTWHADIEILAQADA